MKKWEAIGAIVGTDKLAYCVDDEEVMFSGKHHGKYGYITSYISCGCFLSEVEMNGSINCSLQSDGWEVTEEEYSSPKDFKFPKRNKRLAPQDIVTLLLKYKQFEAFANHSGSRQRVIVEGFDFMNKAVLGKTSEGLMWEGRWHSSGCFYLEADAELLRGCK